MIAFKIIFLSYQPLKNKFFRDFFIKDLIDAGFIVEYWDLTPIYYPGLKMPDKMESDISYVYSSFKELKDSLKNTDITKCLFIPYMTYNYKVMDLFRLLTKINGKIAFFNIGQFPFDQKTKIQTRILDKLKSGLTIPFIIKYFKGKIRKTAYVYKKLGIIKEYDIVFYAGEKSGNNRYKNKTLTVPINLNDYDNYRMVRDIKEKIIKGRYCVFHDEDFVNHPDREMLGLKNINEGEFYALINNFFTIIEKQHHCKVIIAASPKSNYSNNPFNNREIIYFKTNELVKDCLFSIAVASTSISYPVSYRKPIIFFSYSEFAVDGSLYDKYPIILADYLGCSYYLIDNIKAGDSIKPNPLNIDKYNMYKYGYLTSQLSENRLTKDIVIDFLMAYCAIYTL